MDSKIALRMENWRGGDWDETQNGAHVMRRKGCAIQNQGITLNSLIGSLSINNGNNNDNGIN